MVPAGGQLTDEFDEKVVTLQPPDVYPAAHTV